ncbi:MAG: RsmD family RNA methyltransferase [Thermoguttaceae bacterium]|nr:RsmD family RNA methyltransferase [Thermoguttaceae bacterium]MBQ6617683.1 RsmD family RNA methyltransferase [Thermoguttaceae bacterium]
MSQKFEKKSEKTKKSSKNLAGVMVDSVGLRIIGGTFRGRKLEYAGDMRVRPMKDRVRESVFNLIGTDVKGKFVLDLFGGTGAVCLEAISRGAVGGQIVEMHFPTAKTIKKNIETLGLTDVVNLHTGNVFIWNKKRDALPQDAPWAVFICPPYEFFISRWDDLAELFCSLQKQAPKGSLFVVESDQRFDWEIIKTLTPDSNWDIRAYPPAVVGVYRVGE